MSQLTDSEIIAALHQSVPEPPHAPARLADVHRRAQHRRRVQVSAGALATVAVVAAGATVANGEWPGAHPSGQQTAALTPATDLAQLHDRPMHLPSVAAGTPCPVSAAQTYPAGGGFTDPYTAVGDGPFTMTGNGTVAVNFQTPDNDAYAGTGWPGMKVIWRLAPQYTGPVLLRGARVDGQGELRFDHYLDAVGSDSGAQEGTAYPDLAYDTTGDAPILSTYPSAVRVKTPGCYAVQVDGTSFSDVIVFSVTASH